MLPPPLPFVSPETLARVVRLVSNDGSSSGVGEGGEPGMILQVRMRALCVGVPCMCVVHVRSAWCMGGVVVGRVGGWMFGRGAVVGSRRSWPSVTRRLSSVFRKWPSLMRGGVRVTVQVFVCRCKYHGDACR
jgi:hypothetical protein